VLALFHERSSVLLGEFLKPGEYIDELVLYIADRFAIYY
jgi:hypothetical protein